MATSTTTQSMDEQSATTPRAMNRIKWTPSCAKYDKWLKKWPKWLRRRGEARKEARTETEGCMVLTTLLHGTHGVPLIGSHQVLGTFVLWEAEALLDIASDNSNDVPFREAREETTMIYAQHLSQVHEAFFSTTATARNETLHHTPQHTSIAQVQKAGMASSEQTQTKWPTKPSQT